MSHVCLFTRFRQLNFAAFPIDTVWLPFGALYAFASQRTDGLWVLHYIGRTNSMSTRHANHEKEAAAKRSGATHTLVYFLGEEAVRRAWEAELIESYNPPLNNVQPSPTIEYASAIAAALLAPQPTQPSLGDLLRALTTEQPSSSANGALGSLLSATLPPVPD